MKNNLSSIDNGSSLNPIPQSVGLIRGPENDVAAVIGALGISLNALSLVVFIKSKKLLSDIPRKIILHQCVVDLLSGAFLIYSQFHSFYLGIDLPSGLPHPAAYCYIVWSGYILWSLFTISSWNIQLLTIERYMSVCHPIVHKNHCTPLFTTSLLLVVWIGSFAWLVLPIHNIRYVSDSSQCVYAPDRYPVVDTVYGIGKLLHSYIVPIFLMLFAYVRMLIVLKNRMSTSSVGPVSSVVKEARKTRSFITVCATIGLAYVVCYSPNVFYYFLSSIRVIKVLEIDTTFSLFTILMLFANCFINPVIFLMRMSGYRSAVKRLMVWHKIPAENQVSSFAY